MTEPEPLRIKICGITNAGDARAAIQAGADALGLIFIPASPRSVTVDQAIAIMRGVPEKTDWVGVFLNHAIEEIRSIQEILNAQNLGFSVIQLHGDESPDFAEKLHTPVLKVIQSDFELIRIRELQALAAFSQSLQSRWPAILFDRPKSAPPEDWWFRLEGFILAHPDLPRFLVAGGLTPETVHQVISRIATHPNFSGVDVASGVEKQPGLKDHTALAEFIRQARLPLKGSNPDPNHPRNMKVS